jgi:hypothetical protein
MSANPGSLNLLEPSESIRTCTGIALPFIFATVTRNLGAEDTWFRFQILALLVSLLYFFFFTLARSVNQSLALLPFKSVALLYS